MNNKKYLIVTNIDETCSIINKLYCRDVFYTYKKYNNMFDIIDIHEYSISTCKYDVTIIDRFALFRFLYFNSYDSFIDKFKNTHNLVLLTSDLHSWSITLHNKAPNTDHLCADHNNYDLIFKMCQSLNINNIITNYDCPESLYIKNHSSIKIHILEYPIDPNIYKDYQLEKKYDIIFYGETRRNVYPFRHRIKEILKKSQFKTLIIDMGRGHNDSDCGIGLAKKINQAWLGVTTTSNFDYLVGKYFEISACKTCVLGNMNNQGHSIWHDNYVNINNSMTDEQIITTIKSALSNKEKLMSMSSQMYQIIHTNYTLEKHEKKLYDVINSINQT